MVRAPIQALVLVAFVLSATVAQAEVKLASIFMDHMVLQRDMKAPVWGTADPGEKVRVTFGEANAETAADADGKWKVTIGPLPASDKPAELIVTGTNTLKISDVLVGDVWVCGGQSNMAFRLSQTMNAQEELAAANWPSIRYTNVGRQVSPTPMDTAQIYWRPLTPDATKCTAVGYFFARGLHLELKVPIGLIHASVGGTMAEAWTNREALDKLDYMKERLAEHDKRIAGYDRAAATAKYNEQVAAWEKRNAEAKAAGQPVNTHKPRLYDPYVPKTGVREPASLYNGMIAPLIPYGIRGVIFYHGGANADRTGEYRTLFPALIAGWRAQWGQGDFPFLYVQTANYRAVQVLPVEGKWAGLREAQRLTLEALPNVGMASAIDLGEADDIHPKNKQDVGARLVLTARAVVFGQDLVHSGPLYESMETRGNTLVIHFTHTGSGLVVKGNEGKLRGFAVAAATGEYAWADAKIDGDTVVVTCPEIDKPMRVCYSWADNPIGNLYNKEGLPASSFVVGEESGEPPYHRSPNR